MVSLRPRRSVAVLTASLALALSATLVTPTGGAAQARDPRAETTKSWSLPAGFQPEGIATDGRRTAYLGSRVDGDIYRLDLQTGRGSLLAQGPGTPALGLKLDDRDRLFVSGGTGGDVRVLDARTGRLKRTYQLSAGTSFINDVYLSKSAAWLTDAAAPQLYRLPFRERSGNLPRPSQVETLPLTGAWAQLTGNNANGITSSPDGRALLVINSANGLLYRVDPRTGFTTVVDTAGAMLINGDGLLREGRLLYVVQNRLNQIAVLKLDRTGASARPLASIGSSSFDVPSTVARARGRLWLPNARFTTPARSTTTYDVIGSRVRK